MMMSQTHPHGGGQLLHHGADLNNATAVVILLHGRGARAADILRLGDSLRSADHQIAFLAPQAVNNTWYPVSGFLPQEHLAPWLESALMVIDETIDLVLNHGIAAEKIVLGGFSQGAMLSLEYASRGRRQFGGIIAFSGSLIGPVDQPHAPLVPVPELPMFIGCGTNDSWIAASSAEESARLFRDAGANVDLRIYDGMDHTINTDEVEAAKAMITRIAG